MQKDCWKKLNLSKFILIATFFFIILLGNNINAQFDASKKTEVQIADTLSDKSIFADSIKSSAILVSLQHSHIQYDTSDIVIRNVDSIKIKSYLKDKDFMYFEDPESTMTPWERLMNWISKQFARLRELESYGTAWDIFMYVLIAFAVIAITFGIYKSDVKGLFFSNKNKNGLNVSESLEDINTIDFEKMIEEAIANGNYRYAVRLNYLRSLKTLSDKEIIKWKIVKTNREFVREIKEIKIKTQFESITTDFESIWYGGFDVDQLQYAQLQLRFSDFNSSLDNNR
jgi:hypothetical protein